MTNPLGKMFRGEQPRSSVGSAGGKRMLEVVRIALKYDALKGFSPEDLRSPLAALDQFSPFKRV